MKSKRIQWLDFGKGFAIFCVVLFHCTQFIFPHSMLLLRNVLEVFMMPVFFAISGFLYKPNLTRRSYLLLLYKKVSSFTIPYIIFSLVLYILNKLYFLMSTPWHPYPYNTPIYAVFLHGAYLWFLLTLFIIFIFIASTIYLFRSKSIYEKAGIVFLLLFLLVLISRTGGIIFYLYWLACFVFGWCFKKFRLYQFTKLMHKIILPLFIFEILLLYIQFDIEKSSEYDTGSNPISIYSVIPTFIGILLLFVVFIIFNRNSRIFKCLCGYGRYTLFIYLIHFPMMLVIGKYLKELSFSKYMLWIILLITVLVISIASCKLLCFSVVKFLFYPKKCINKIIEHTQLGKKLGIK